MFDNLMWALYWIDVLSSLPSALGHSLVIGFFLGGGFWIFFCLANGIDDVGREQQRAIQKRATRITLGFFLALQVMVTIGCLFPSKQTMYLMLGVKVTDGVVNSEVGQKVQKVLNGKLDEYLSTFEGKKGEKK